MFDPDSGLPRIHEALLREPNIACHLRGVDAGDPACHSVFFDVLRGLNLIERIIDDIVEKSGFM
jgi:hypothetical protein